jgi:hypothetical protein
MGRRQGDGLRRSITLAVLLVATVPAGCGGSYTKRDFIARADAICASSLREARAIGPPSSGGAAGASSAALSGYLAKLLPVVEAETSRLRALQSPRQSARDRATFDRWMAALAQDVEGYRRLAAAAGRGDIEGVVSAEAVLRTSPAAGLAASYGLRACGTPRGTSA